MKILITADIHNGVPGKLKDTLWSMQIIQDYANKNGIDTVLILGDLFHNRENLNIEVLNGVYDQLSRLEDLEQEWICFPGNHDIFLKDSWRINSLRPLENILTTHESISNFKIGNRRFWVLPFIYYEDRYNEELSKIEEEYKDGDILLTHIGVNNATLNECFLLKNWSFIDFTNSKFKRVFTGHFHCHQSVGENVIYPGSPIPFRFDEGLVDHGFIVFDIIDDSWEFVKIFDICGEFSDYVAPDYLTVEAKDILKVDLKDNNIKIILNKDFTLDELSQLRSALSAKGALDIKWDKQFKKADEIEQIDEPIDESDLFSKWVEHDNPEGYKKDLLFELHDGIAKEAEELISRETEE